MDNLSYTTNQDIIALLCQRLKEYRLAARISQKEVLGMEQRLSDLLPKLPVPPMALKQMNKYIPKRVRRNSDDKEF